MKRPDIESIKSMYNDAPIVFIQGARQAVPELIEYIEQLEKDINMFRNDAIETIDKTKLRNIQLDLISDKVKKIIEYNKLLTQALKTIYNITTSDRKLSMYEAAKIYNTARNALGGIKND